jgi:hypothetical protein
MTKYNMTTASRERGKKNFDTPKETCQEDAQNNMNVHDFV